MQRIEDLAEILTALREIGNHWHEENLSLRADNARLLNENKNLRDEWQKLSSQNDSLQHELKSLSEKMATLKEDLRDEIIKELAVAKRDDFQKDVRLYLKEILKNLNEPSPEAKEAPSVQEESSAPYQS